MATLEELDKAFENFSKKFPDARRKLVNDVGDVMHKEVINNIERDVEEGGENLKRGATKVIGSKGGYAAIRPDYSIAPHTHLVEDGHDMIVGGKKGKGGNVSDDRAFVYGKHMYRNAINQVADKIENMAEEFIEELVESF